jgi:UDP-N-acetylglucosamine 4,6-dehydratase
MFKGKTLVITGGTGSFGNAVLKRFLETDILEIRIFSRDEKKQDDMRKHYNNPKLKFYIGDVRNQDSLMELIMFFTRPPSSRCRRANFSPFKPC